MWIEAETFIPYLKEADFMSEVIKAGAQVVGKIFVAGLCAVSAAAAMNISRDLSKDILLRVVPAAAGRPR